MRNEAILSLLKTLRFNGMLSQFDEMMEAAEIKKLNPQALCLILTQMKHSQLSYCAHQVFHAFLQIVFPKNIIFLSSTYKFLVL